VTSTRDEGRKTGRSLKRSALCASAPWRLCERSSDAKNQDAKNQDAKNQDAKNQDAKNQDAKNQDAKVGGAEASFAIAPRRPRMDSRTTTAKSTRNRVRFQLQPRRRTTPRRALRLTIICASLCASLCACSLDGPIFEIPGLRIRGTDSFPADRVLDDTFAFAFTDAGRAFVERDGILLLSALLGGEPGVLDISELVNDYLAANPIDVFGFQARDVRAVIRFADPRGALQLTVLPDPARLRVHLVGAWIAIEATVYDDSGGVTTACRVIPDADIGVGEPQSLILSGTELEIIFGVAPDGSLALSVDLIDLGVARTAIGIVTDSESPDFYCALPECADTCFECTLFCEGANLVLDVTDFFLSLFETILTNVLEDVTNDILAALRQVEGELHLGLLSGTLVDLTFDAEWLDFRVEPGGAGFLSRPTPGSADPDARDLLSSFGGGVSSPPHACVGKPDGQPELLPPTPFVLSPGATDSQFLVSVSDTFLNQGAWAAYVSGTLCLFADAELVRLLTDELELDAGLLGLLLPGLSDLVPDDAPLLVSFQPRIDPLDFPVIELGAPGEDLLRVDLPEVTIGMYAWVYGRYLQLFELTAAVDIDLGVAVLPDNVVELTLDDVAVDIASTTASYNELFRGADLQALVGFAVELMTGSFLDDGFRLELSVSDLIAEVIALPFDLRIVDVRSSADGRWLELGASIDLRDPSADATRLVDTTVALRAAGPGWIDLDVTAPGYDAADLEYQARVRPGPWTSFRPATEARLRSSLLRLTGPRAVEVRARARGDYRSLDPSPALLRLPIGSEETP
jgi:hypothetical protein